jgi:hypothetical protein
VVYLPAAKVVHGYRRRLAKRPVSRQSLGLALSYLMLRIKHAGAIGRPASSEGLAVVAGAGRPAFQVALQHD